MVNAVKSVIEIAENHKDLTDEKKYPPLSNPPYHVGIIMDGNGRWAKERGKPHLEGHRAGTENLRRVLESSVEFGVKMLTIYAFSTENWKRPPLEVQGLMRILENDMIIMLPLGNVDNVGLREIIAQKEVPKLYSILKKRDVVIDNQTWNRRYREYMDKIKTGSVYEVAEVYRDLLMLKLEKELSFGERKMLDIARSLLVKEISLAENIEETIFFILFKLKSYLNMIFTTDLQILLTDNKMYLFDIITQNIYI